MADAPASDAVAEAVAAETVAAVTEGAIEAAAPAPAPAAAPPPKPTPPAMTAISEDVVEAVAAPPPTGGSDAEAVTKDQIDLMSPDEVLPQLGRIVSSMEDAGSIELAAHCCKRVRVLCRESQQRELCDKMGAARTLIAAFDAGSNNPVLVLQSLAALVNLCSGDAHPPRTAAVNAGAIRAAATAIKGLGSSIEIGEMACLVVQNLCFGDDPEAKQRRAQAHKDGAIEAVIAVLSTHVEIKDTCVASLRLCVDRMPDLRQIALEKGATDEAVKPITKEGGGLLSFRGGFGTNRRKANKMKMQESSGGN